MSRKREQKYQNRLIAFMVVVIMLVFAYVCCGSTTKGKEPTAELNTKTAESKQLISYAGIEEYRVQSFDTLSRIAIKYIPSDKYMSKWISNVKRLNNRKSNDIYYDEVIRVYVYEK